jgi:MbtH protein
MPDEDSQDDRVYAVVINDEEQYSIWPDGSEAPAGWTKTGFTGQKSECLQHVDEVWTDMRPLSLRKAMAAEAAQGGATDSA